MTERSELKMIYEEVFIGIYSERETRSNGAWEKKGMSKVEDRWQNGGGNNEADIAPSQGRIRQNLAWEIFRMAGGLLQRFERYQQPSATTRFQWCRFCHQPRRTKINDLSTFSTLRRTRLLGKSTPTGHFIVHHGCQIFRCFRRSKGGHMAKSASIWTWCWYWASTSTLRQRHQHHRRPWKPSARQPHWRQVFLCTRTTTTWDHQDDEYSHRKPTRWYFTKPLARKKFERLRELMGIREVKG